MLGILITVWIHLMYTLSTFFRSRLKTRKRQCQEKIENEQ